MMPGDWPEEHHIQLLKGSSVATSPLSPSLQDVWLLFLSPRSPSPHMSVYPGTGVSSSCTGESRAIHFLRPFPPRTPGVRIPTILSASSTLHFLPGPCPRTPNPANHTPNRRLSRRLPLSHRMPTPQHPTWVPSTGRTLQKEGQPPSFRTTVLVIHASIEPSSYYGNLSPLAPTRHPPLPIRKWVRTRTIRPLIPKNM